MYRRTRCKSGRVCGVLCDWDLAYDPENPYPQRQTTLQADPSVQINTDHIVFEKHSEEHVGPCYRTGTGPFMALDLLMEGKVPLHLYRHDLESFFFVLVWFCAVFDPETHTLGHLRNWESSDLVSIGFQKRHFLQNPNAQKAILGNISPQYQPLIMTWIRNLFPMFVAVNGTSLSRIQEQATFEAWAMLAGETDTGQRHAEEIAELEKARNEMVTYEKFARCLGIDITVDNADSG